MHKYLAYDDPNNQEVFKANNELDAMKKALKLFRITIVELKDECPHKKKPINCDYCKSSGDYRYDSAECTNH